MWRRRPSWGCATRRALLAAALAAAVVVLYAAGGSPNGMPASLFFDDDAQADIPASNLTADHLLDGLLTTEFSYRSCRSRYEFAGYHKKSLHKPSPYLLAKLRNQEALQKRCGPGTAAHKKALRQLDSGEGVAHDDADCRYLVYINYRGLGNRMLAIASAFLYAVLTERVLLVDGGKEVADLFCEPFPGTTWLLPRAGWRSPLRRLVGYDGGSKESLGNMLQSGAVVVSADGNASWSSPQPPPYVYLHLAGGYGFHDKLFFCGAHQRLLRGVPWLLMRTDNYIVPGLFLMSPFRGELEAMFPEKDAAFYHLGRYLFHPTNAVWHAVTSYYRSTLAAADRRVGIQIRVFHKKQPPQRVLDQLLSCVRDEKLIPETIAGNDTLSHAIMVTSLSSWYYERIKGEYGGRVAGGVHQPSHEGRQRWEDTAHNMRALSEMYLLSMCDVLVTSGYSTFGYVAQVLAGLRPWVMARPPMWADDWTEGLDPQALPCQRAASIEPCFHSPSAYNCATGRDVDLDKVTPYIRRCVDVSCGIKLVNESSSQW
ncbi:galactoside 2-alpha-L-fucosyltransferase-like isoform X2 [Phragmites australis]|uniref:galactoside 2-alpha-L-fucosyltransferase-like isoform X2 n=1 Tax=Phragmites australis TaxID=29695 RepID=UPI002D78B066|nr:galactoside 2-alpha-L-fucosyltransferase-like isoform X2 [Phragmites australis]